MEEEKITTLRFFFDGKNTVDRRCVCHICGEKNDFRVLENDLNELICHGGSKRNINRILYVHKICYESFYMKNIDTMCDILDANFVRKFDKNYLNNPENHHNEREVFNIISKHFFIDKKMSKCSICFRHLMCSRYGENRSFDCKTIYVCDTCNQRTTGAH